MLPVANMPTDQRALFHATPKRKIESIGRSIEQAITMFAPGTVTTKDKQKHGDWTDGQHPIKAEPEELESLLSLEWREQLTIDTTTNALVHIGDPETMPPNVPWAEQTQTFTAVKPAGFVAAS